MPNILTQVVKRTIPVEELDRSAINQAVVASITDRIKLEEQIGQMEGNQEFWQPRRLGQQDVAGFIQKNGGPNPVITWTLGRQLNAAELDQMWKAAREEFEKQGVDPNWVDDFAFYTEADGFSLLDADWYQYEGEVVPPEAKRAVIERLDADFGIEHSWIDSEGFSEFNNWSTDKNGEGYEEVIRSLVEANPEVASDLLERVDRRISAPLQRVYDKWSEAGYGRAGYQAGLQPRQVNRAGQWPGIGPVNRALANREAIGTGKDAKWFAENLQPILLSKTFT